MLIVILVCVTMLALTTAVHFEVLSTLSRGLPILRLRSRLKVLVALSAIFLAHVLEIALYALALLLLVRLGVGTMSEQQPLNFETSLYFSAETYSSLGYGDLVPLGALRLLAGAETLNGLLMIGWSASYIHIAMERFWGPNRESPVCA